MIGSRIADGAGDAFTDFRLHDGCSRFLVRNRTMSPRQAGRMVQRLLEIETYRMMALLALPVAQQLTPYLSASERELSQITTLLAASTETDEPRLLDRLTRLEAGIESRESENAYRFAAAAAYYELVQRRIDELRELRIQGLQTFREFTERRLAPAMNTCRAAAARQESLSQRVARATQLLSTRVDVTREKQNQAVLESMNRRAAAQLRLQQTVEGLSVAAITYYIVGLVGYAAKGAKAAGLAVNPEIAMAVSIPLVLVLGMLGLRKVRKSIARSLGQPGDELVDGARARSRALPRARGGRVPRRCTTFACGRIRSTRSASAGATVPSCSPDEHQQRHRQARQVALQRLEVPARHHLQRARHVRGTANQPRRRIRALRGRASSPCWRPGVARPPGSAARHAKTSRRERIGRQQLRDRRKNRARRARAAAAARR